MTLKIEDLIGKGDGKTVLVCKDGVSEYQLVGVVNGKALLNSKYGTNWESDESIKDYEIKKPAKKYWQWMIKNNTGEIYTTSYYCDEDKKTPAGEIISSNEFIRKIGKPIDQDGNELEE